MIANHNLILYPLSPFRGSFAVHCTCGWRSVIRFSSEAAARRQFAWHVTSGPVGSCQGPQDGGRARGSEAEKVG